MPGFFALGASLEMLARWGLTKSDSPIAERVLEIAGWATSALEKIGAKIISSPQEQHRSGIVAFEMPGRDPRQLRGQCLAASVALSCRAGRLRISPHAYVNEDDIERLLSALRENS